MKIIVQWVTAVFLGVLPMSLQGVNYVIQDLGTLDTEESHATGINNQNTIIGCLKKGKRIDTFIWKPTNEVVFLPYPSY